MTKCNSKLELTVINFLAVWIKRLAVSVFWYWTSFLPTGWTAVQMRANGAFWGFLQRHKLPNSPWDRVLSKGRWLLSLACYWKQSFHRVIDRHAQQNSAVSAAINSHGKDSQYVQLEAIMILAFLSWCSSIMLSASFALLGSPPASIKPLMFWVQSSISFISRLNFCNWYEAASFSFLPHNVQFSIIQHRII